MIHAQFPERLEFLFRPSRYKIIRGGRGSGKSWGIARALLLIGSMKPTRILCTREVQRTLAQSVHQLLCDQIESLGLSSFYETLNNEIRGKNGTQFFFSGLSNQTADSIKSFEGVEIAWCEEAQSLSDKSLEILIPTIRAKASELWFSFNPQLESDPVFERFIKNPPPDCVSVLMNFRDNPFFPAVLEIERQHAQSMMAEGVYNNIWEGKCRPAVEGAIYFDQMSAATGRIREVPHDPLLKTHAVWDLGYNDSMSIILAQKVSSEIRITHYIEGTQRTLVDYSAELKALRLDDQPLNWGCHYLPHDGFAKRHQTGKMDAEVLQGLGWNVQRTPNLHVEDGIKRAREVFGRVYFNRGRTVRLVECLKRYRRAINQMTNEPGAPLHDEFSHGADAFRYLSLTADQMSNDEWSGVLKYPRLTTA